MHVSPSGKITLDIADVRRMMEGVYIVRRLTRDADDMPEAEKTRVMAATDVIVAEAKKYGGKHFNADGTVKEPQSRKRNEGEAPKETPAP
jgi:hypothetical protein